MDNLNDLKQLLAEYSESKIKKAKSIYLAIGGVSILTAECFYILKPDVYMIYLGIAQNILYFILGWGIVKTYIEQTKSTLTKAHTILEEEYKTGKITITEETE